MRQTGGAVFYGIPLSDPSWPSGGQDDGEVHPCAYEETESYQVMEMFINSRELLLKKLLKDL